MKFRKIKTIPINDLRVGQYFTLYGGTNDIKILIKSLSNNISINNARSIKTNKLWNYYNTNHDKVNIYQKITESDDMGLDFL